MASSYQYSLIAENRSPNAGTFGVFQQDAGLGVSDVLPLAWMVKGANPTTRVTFSWSADYDFVWYDSGKLTPGILCVASQTWPADLSTSNQVTLTRNGNGFTFTDQKAGPAEGNLYVVQDGSIPATTASVGIGMAGSGTFVIQAQPNLTTTFTSPDPQIWIAFSLPQIVRGQVLDPNALPAPNTQVVYPANVYSMTAILESDNTWTVQPTSEANAARIARARAADAP